MINDVAVIGAGPAGMSASIYLKRAGFEPLLFERDRVGGLLLNANLVENYPGFPGGITGSNLVSLFEKQQSDHGINVLRNAVLTVLKEEDVFRIRTENGDFLSRTVIVATGTRPKKVSIDGIDELPDGRIFYQVSDVPSIQNGKRFIVIGAGDAAFDYALNLSANGCNVRIVMRARDPKCIPLLEKRARADPNIEILGDTNPISIRFENNTLHLDCESGGKEIVLQSDYLLIACGREPNMDLLHTDIGERIEKTGDQTKVPGLFLAGDVLRGDFRQVGIAVGDGIVAAMQATLFLKKEGSDEDSG
jgi:thioredoxin reductase